MRALVQRVKKAQVLVDGEVVGAIGPGALVFLGVTHDDTEELGERLADKLWRLRIFEDSSHKTNRSIADTDGELLVVSQFTLYASCKKGLRPSFVEAAPAEQAERLYEHFCSCLEGRVKKLARGRFGAMMEVALTNDGPFTVWLDTDELF